MGRLLEIVTPLHKATKRNYLARMNDYRVHCMVTRRKTIPLRRAFSRLRAPPAGVSVLGLAPFASLFRMHR